MAEFNDRLAEINEGNKKKKGWRGESSELGGRDGPSDAAVQLQKSFARTFKIAYLGSNAPTAHVTSG